MTVATSSQPPSKALIISDQSSTCLVLTRLLEKIPVTVEIESVGRSGLERSLKEEYFIVVVDCLIQDLDCLDILKSIKLTNHRTRVVMILKEYCRERMEGVLSQGADGCLWHPLTELSIAGELYFTGKNSGFVLNLLSDPR